MKKFLCICLLALALGLCLSSVRPPARAEALHTGYTLYLDENYPGALIGAEYNATTVTLPSAARSGYYFCGWAESRDGEVVYVPGETITLESDLTLYAQWTDTSYYSVRPKAYTLSGSGYTDIPCSLALYLRYVTFWNGMTQREEKEIPNYIVFFMNAGTLTDGSGNSIPFLVSNEFHTELGTYVVADGVFSSANTAFGMSVYIDPDDYVNAIPGTYTGELVYDGIWEINHMWHISAGQGAIALTLVVTEHDGITVTVNNGTGSGEYAEGSCVTITADDPAPGKKFAGWTGADGLTFLYGSAANATADFIMPANEVTLTATYEDILYPITTDGTAEALHETGWLDWQPTAEAVMGEELKLQIADGAEPAEGYYFTGEFLVNGVSLGSETDENGLFSWPVEGMTMPAEAISIAAAQALRETVTLDFTQDTSLSVPYAAVVQLRNGSESAELFILDDDWNESIDLDGGGTPDIAVTGPDYVTTADYTLTLLPGACAEDPNEFTFTGPTDRYGTISILLPDPTPSPTPAPSQDDLFSMLICGRLFD